MEDFDQDYFQLEIGRAVTDMQNAQVALTKAKSAATVDDKEVRRAWTLVLAHNRTAIWLACTIGVAEAVGYLPSITPDLVRVAGFKGTSQ